MKECSTSKLSGEGGPNPKFPNFDVSILHRDRRSKEENHVRWRDLMPSNHRQGSEGIGEPHGAGEALADLEEKGGEMLKGGG